MNQRDYDLIVRAAYGELEPGEKTFVDEMLLREPEARKLYQEFASMQTNLKAMDDVPACQLSSERLRQAILDSGTQPAIRMPWRLSWGHGLAAAACLAIAFVAIRTQQVIQPSALPRSESPVANAESNMEPTAPLVAQKVPDDTINDLFDAITSTATPSAIDSSESVHQSRPVNKAVPKPAMKKGTQDKPSVLQPGAGGNLVAVASTPQADNAYRAAATEPSRDVEAYVPEGPVVVVQPQTDPRTGAALAFESSHGSDLVFGG